MESQLTLRRVPRNYLRQRRTSGFSQNRRPGQRNPTDKTLYYYYISIK